MRKRIVSLLMAMLILAAMVPTAAWAEEIALPATVEEVGQEAQETPQDVQDVQDEPEAQKPAGTDEPEMPPAPTAEDAPEEEPVPDTPALPEPETQSIADNSTSVLTAESAGSGTCGENLTWTLDEQGTLTISGTGMMDDYTTTPYYWYTVRNSITTIIIEGGVTSIGSCAFYDFPHLNSVTLPSSLSSIGNYAFYKSSALTSITLPRRITSIGNYAFYASSLTNITLPSHISCIGDYAFHECTSLTDIYYNNYGIDWLKCCGSKAVPDDVTVHFKDNLYGMGDCGINAKWELTADGTLTISGTGQITNYSDTWDNNPAPWSIAKQFICKVIIERGVTAIGSYAFSSCINLTDVTIPDTTVSIRDYALSFCSNLVDITIPDSIISIGNGAFHSCSALTSITIPSNVTSIGDSIFANCSALTSAIILGKVVSTGTSTFSSCSALTHVSLPDSIISVGDDAFRYCSALTNIFIPNSVTSIGDAAFCCCSALTDVIIPNNVTFIGTRAFERCSNLARVTISNSVTSVCGAAFSDCSSLTSITIPNSVTYLGGGAFSNCSQLKESILSDSLTDISSSLFSNCPRLTSVTISENVTHIGDYAFNYCASLKDVYFKGKKDQWATISIGSDNEDLLNATIHCAAGLGIPTMTLTNASNGNPIIKWTKVDGAAQYEVYRSDTGKDNTFKIIRRTAGLTFTDTAAAAGKTYHYVVRAINGSTAGKFCAPQSVAVSGALGVPTMQYYMIADTILMS